MEISVEMKPFQILHLNETGELKLLDRNHNLIRRIEYADDIPLLKKGLNHVITDADFDDVGSSQLKVEIMSKGPAELAGRP